MRRVPPDVRDLLEKLQKSLGPVGAPIALHSAAWIAILGVGSLLLRGRYDVSPEAWEATSKGYLSSLYFFVPTLPSAYYLLRASPLRPRVVQGITAGLFFLLCLPYRWLGLDRLHYRLEPHFWSDGGAPAPTLTFLPSTFPVESFPHERLFFVALFIVFVGAVVALVARGTAEQLTARAAAER